MNIQESGKTCFAKYVDFSGRASRSEYWWFVLIYFVASIIGAVIHPYVQYIVILAFFLPLLAAGTRRLHDIGKSGWFQLLGLIPIVNLVLIYFYVQPSQPDSNIYGAPPTV
ncbi:MAG: DUF805 domain-containing protein [Variovorax sp.]|nr:MAG: DUF805 domain-containing protein [Variovorax sp.]